jgi:hypothetical protein
VRDASMLHLEYPGLSKQKKKSEKRCRLPDLLESTPAIVKIAAVVA